MFVIGTVAGPRDARVVEWAAYWRHRGLLLVVVQAGPDWLTGELAQKLIETAPDIEILTVQPTGNADMHWNTLIAVALEHGPEVVVTCKGTDEFMAEDAWKRLKRIVRGDPEGKVFWVSYRDYFDGVHLKEMQNGPDYHPIVIRGASIYYDGRFHTWPQPRCSMEEVSYLPEDIFIEHRRVLADVLNSNRAREAFGRPNDLQLQQGFLAKLKQACDSHGLAWPEEEQK